MSKVEWENWEAIFREQFIFLAHKIQITILHI